MTKPAYNSINHGTQSWDTPINDNFVLLGNTVPIPEFASLAALQTAFPANQNDRCVASVNDATAGWVLALSDGTNWVIVGKQTANQANSAALTVAALVTDFNALLAKLIAAGVMHP